MTETNLIQYQAKLCYTAGATLIYKGKILLIKHKKIGLWMSPGGHIDADEAPHIAAEREFFEETGVRVKAIDNYLKKSELALAKSNKSKQFEPMTSQFLPVPVIVNLHWVNKESYDIRIASDIKNERVKTDKWKRGCEQHLNYLYLVEPQNPKELNFKQNIEETDGIAWFTLDQIKDLETVESIRQEIYYCFEVYNSGHL